LASANLSREKYEVMLCYATLIRDKKVRDKKVRDKKVRDKKACASGINSS
jgi:hypothetical protein